jgi:hypothetical protein
VTLELCSPATVPRPELEEAEADGVEVRIPPPIQAGGCGSSRVAGGGGDTTGDQACGRPGQR